MAMEEDNESCGSRPVQSPQRQSRQQKQKLEVYNEVLSRIRDLNCEEANLLGFDDQLWLHFNRFTSRYALDVNVDRAEDVLTHKRLLQLAEDPANRPAFDVRLVHVYPIANGNSVDSVNLDSSMKEDAQSSFHNGSRLTIHPPPTFGSSPNPEAPAIQGNKDNVEDEDSAISVTPYLSRFNPQLLTS
ncbi:serine/threonine-protein kinase STY17-like isoform X2 [Quercus suber]|uniref:serine/threonine-protein kinase STY17-like isoform X2 n=1 Tax=Quercus suber TaxID=58331 RepID=UPI0032E031E4